MHIYQTNNSCLFILTHFFGSTTGGEDSEPARQDDITKVYFTPDPLAENSSICQMLWAAFMIYKGAVKR